MLMTRQKKHLSPFLYPAQNLPFFLFYFDFLAILGERVLTLQT